MYISDMYSVEAREASIFNCSSISGVVGGVGSSVGGSSSSGSRSSSISSSSSY